MSDFSRFQNVLRSIPFSFETGHFSNQIGYVSSQIGIKSIEFGWRSVHYNMKMAYVGIFPDVIPGVYAEAQLWPIYKSASSYFKHQVGPESIK